MSLLSRLDGWVNLLTAFGTARDKTSGTTYVSEAPIPDAEATALYRGDDISKKIVQIFPREMLRQGYEIKADTPEWSEKIKERCEAFNLTEKFFDAMVWGRLYGGSLLWWGGEDFRESYQPLGPVKEVKWIDVYDKRRLTIVRTGHGQGVYCAGGTLDYMRPEIYQITGLAGGISYVHASRVIRFGGAHTDEETRYRLSGWDDSVLYPLLEPIRAFNEAFHSARLMISEASVGVFKMKGLLEALSGGESDTLRTRAQMLDMGKGVARSLILDVNEDYTKVPTVFAGVSDILDRAALRLAAATDIPVAVLMGQSPAGLQSTGAADIRIFYDRVESERKQILDAPFLRVVKMIAASMGYAGKVEVERPSLWQESPQEKALRNKTTAETDQIYFTIGATMPEDIAAARRAGSVDFPEESDVAPAWTRTPPAPEPAT